LHRKGHVEYFIIHHSGASQTTKHGEDSCFVLEINLCWSVGD